MKIKIILITILFLSSITKSISQSIDLNQLKGTWDFPCSATFDSPNETLCVDMTMESSINCNSETGKGKLISREFGVIHNFEIYFEDDKTMIKYHYENDIDIGEIIKLDEKELKIKFDEDRYFLIFEKIK